MYSCSLVGLCDVRALGMRYGHLPIRGKFDKEWNKGPVYGIEFVTLDEEQSW